MRGRCDGGETSMFCPVCGTKVGDNARFCTGCGAPLDALQQGGFDASAQVSQVESVNPAGSATPVNFGSPAPTPQQPKRSNMLDFLVEKRQIGNRLVPTFALIIASFIAAAGIAYAAFMLYKNVVEPRIQEPVQQEQTRDTARADGGRKKSEINVTVRNESMTVSVPIDAIMNPGEREDREWAYPQLKSDTKDDAIDAINDQIKNSMQADVDRTGLPAADGSDGGDGIVDGSGPCVNRQITATYLSDRYFCIRDERYDTNWGPHGMTTVTGVVFDLRTGKTVNPLTLFGETSESVSSAIANAMMPYVQDNPYWSKDYGDVASWELEYGMSGSSLLYVTDEGLVYHSQDYELGSYAAGNVDVVVRAWEDNSLVGTLSSRATVQEGSSVIVNREN